MTTNLQHILERLDAEGLHGPLSPYRIHGDERPRYIEREYEESDDPRWFGLFVEFFLADSSTHDDLLFFVREVSKDSKEDPIFVKRKGVPPNVMPLIKDTVVLWMETFWLNLIVQLPCELFVAVCKQEVNQKTSLICSRPYFKKKVYALPTKSRMDTKESSPECSYPLIYYVVDEFEDVFEQHVLMEGEHLAVELSVTLPGSVSIQGSATKLEKMDEEDGAARSNRVGTVDSDGDGDVSDIDIDAGNEPRNGRRRQKRAGPTRPIPQIVEPFNIPFPPPSEDGDFKITLFQGALSYNALSKLYQQRIAGKATRRFKLGAAAVTSETVYVGVRGPKGKGHAQLAVTGVSRSESGVDISSSQSLTPDKPERIVLSRSMPSSPTLSPSRSTPSKAPLAEIVNPKAERPTSLFASFKRFSFGDGARQHSQKNNGGADKGAAFLAPRGEPDVTGPDALKCCLTFVNVDWQGVASDLMAYNRNKKPIV